MNDDEKFWSLFKKEKKQQQNAVVYLFSLCRVYSRIVTFSYLFIKNSMYINIDNIVINERNKFVDGIR